MHEKINYETKLFIIISTIYNIRILNKYKNQTLCLYYNTGYSIIGI